MAVVESGVSAARARVAAVYDPATFAAAGERLIGALAEHFSRVQAGEGAALNWTKPGELIREAAACGMKAKSWPLPEDRGAVAARVVELARECLAHGQNLHHPHYVGHQVPPPMTLSALFDLVGSATNQAMAIYEMGPWATAAERVVVAAVGEQLGFERDRFSGLVTSGGSLANLTGLLTARK